MVGYARESDAPVGDNEGSATVEAESLLVDEIADSLVRVGVEALDDDCHHNANSVVCLH